MCIVFFCDAGLLIFLLFLPIGSYVVTALCQGEGPRACQVGRPTDRGQWVLTLGQVGSLTTFVRPYRLPHMYDFSDPGAASWAHLQFAVFVMCMLVEAASSTIRSPPFGGTRFACGRSPNETELSLSMVSG